jgi:hypothetical protein
MAESQTIVILRAKREAIGAAIINYERQLEQAKRRHWQIFDQGDKPGSQRPYTSLCRAFRYGEIASMCRTKLADGPCSTPDIARHVMATKGIDAADRVLARSIGFSVLQSLRGMARRCIVQKLPKSRGRCVWALAAASGA